MLVESGVSIRKRRRRTVTDDVYNEIIKLIEAGEYKPGDKLPSQQEMELKFEVSRPTLREALARLVNAGVIEARQGQGFFVMEKKLNVFIEHPLRMDSVDRKDIRNLFEARLVLESSMAAMASLFASDEECKELIRIAKNDDAREERCANSFHKAVAKYSHNSFLTEFEISLLEVFDKAYANKFPSLNDRESRQRYEIVPHVKIAEAIAAHDPKGAYDATFKHIIVYAEDIGLSNRYKKWITSDELDINT